MSVLIKSLIATYAPFNYRSVDAFALRGSNTLKIKIITGLSTLVFLIPAIAFAQDVISTDIAVNNPPGSAIEDQVVAKFNGTNTVASVTDMGLPSSADVAALHYIDENTILFTLKSTAQLGLVTANVGDVMQWKNGDITTVVSGATLGLGPATGVDALTQDGTTLIFSTNIADVVNGVSITDSDLLAWSNISPTELLLDQSVCGIPAEADLSGVHLMDTGHYLMTFSSSSVIGGVPARRADIMQCDPSANTVALYRRFTDLSDSWAYVGLDAISRSISELIFTNSFED